MIDDLLYSGRGQHGSSPLTKYDSHGNRPNLSLFDITQLYRIQKPKSSEIQKMGVWWPIQWAKRDILQQRAVQLPVILTQG